jgi:hypothetical protein
MLRHDTALADGLDDLQYALDDLQQGVVQADLIAHAIAFVYEVTTGAATGLKIFNANAAFKFEVTDVIIQPRRASTNGTLKITDGTSDITDAMTCAVDKTIARAATIDDAKSTIAAGGTLQIVCAGDSIGNTQALVTVIVVPRA